MGHHGEDFPLVLLSILLESYWNAITADGNTTNVTLSILLESYWNEAVEKGVKA